MCRISKMYGLDINFKVGKTEALYYFVGTGCRKALRHLAAQGYLVPFQQISFALLQRFATVGVCRPCEIWYDAKTTPFDFGVAGVVP